MVTAGGWLADQISVGILAASVPRDAVDDAIAVTGRQARRRSGVFSAGTRRKDGHPASGSRPYWLLPCMGSANQQPTNDLTCLIGTTSG